MHAGLSGRWGQQMHQGAVPPSGSPQKTNKADKVHNMLKELTAKLKEAKE